ncbi:hypothetical protein [Microbacterium paraoxydans]|nr:hypothetical protein [Microbacterium paraoxydans]
MTSQMKPTSFKNGVPKAERNGMFGAEDRLIELAKAGGTVTAIVTYSVPKVMHDEIADERYPVVQIDHIEPLFEEKAEASATKLRDTAYKARTAEGALDIPEVEA